MGEDFAVEVRVISCEGEAVDVAVCVGVTVGGFGAKKAELSWNQE